MVDPVNFTNYNRTDAELEETILFGICVAGKDAITTARAVDRFLARAHKSKRMKEFAPFQCLRKFSQARITDLLLESGIGCQSVKGRSVHELVNSRLDLRTCTEDDLDNIYGIGLKTAKMFVLHTRRDYEVAVPDVHILKHLKKFGYDAPKQTQGSKKKYRELELVFIDLARKAGQSCADFDLSLWKEYR